MSERKRLFFLILIMTTASLLVVGIAISVLYSVAMDEQRARLMETTQNQARLIEAVARFDAIYSKEDHPEGAAAATLNQITDAHQRYKKSAETGEHTLARREGDNIVFLLSHKFYDLDHPRPVPFDSELAQPMRRALSGQSGTMVGLDYRGEVVLAAYEPVAELDLGIVAKMDLAEVRAPFVRAGAIAIGTTLLIVLLGAALFLRVSNPMIRRLEEYAESLEKIVDRRTAELTATNRQLQQDITERKRAKEKMAVLYAIAATVSRSLDLEKILNDALDEMLRLEALKTQAGAKMFLLDKQTGMLTLVAQRRMPPEHPCLHTPVKMGECLCGLTAEQNRAIISEDSREDERHTRYHPCIPPHKDICVPLKSRDRVLGILNVWIPASSEVDESEVELLTAIGDQIGVAIENGQLYGRVEARARELNQDLMTQKQYAENVLQSIADGVYTVDRQRVVLSWSRGAEAITGYTAEEAIGRTCADFLRHTDEAGQVLCDSSRCPLERVWVRGQPVESEQVFVSHKDGHVVPMAVSVASIFDEEGQAVGAVEVFRDISRERELMERTQATSRAKSEFLANMSHELRTPLNAIIGFSEILQDQTFGPLNERQARYADNIVTSGRHLLQIINDILDLSKVESGKMELHREPFSPQAALEDVLTMVKMKALGHGSSVSLDAKSAPETIEADPRLFKQIMFNLLSNAVKFTPAGGHVTVSAKKMDRGEIECIEVSVSDTGIGIGEENRERIFREFEQVDSSLSRRYEGTGLGLPLTRRLVEMHEGEIWVESEGERKGSTFTFVIPVGAEDVTREP